MICETDKSANIMSDAESVCLDLTPYNLDLLRDETDPLISAGSTKAFPAIPDDNASSSWQDQVFFDFDDGALCKTHLRLPKASPSSVVSEDLPPSPLSESPEESTFNKEFLQLLAEFDCEKRDKSTVFTSCHTAPLIQTSEKSSPLHAAGPVEASTSRQEKPNLLKSISSNVSKRGVKRKANQLEEEEEGDETILAKNKKNALAARENRLKKKKEWENLMSHNSSLLHENNLLRNEKSEHVEKIAELKEQLAYYKSLLFNDSRLAVFLQSMTPKPNLRLSSSVGKSTQFTPALKVPALGAGIPDSEMSGGVCLHVNGTDASLEFCSKCSLSAQAMFKS